MHEILTFRSFNLMNGFVNKTTVRLIKYNLRQKRYINSGKSNDKVVKNNKKSFVNKINNNFELKENQTKTFNNLVKSDSNLMKTLNVDQMAFRVTVTEMQRFLANNKINVSTGRTCLSLKCPFCHHLNDQNLNQINQTIDSTLFLNKTTSDYICYSCERSGNWTQFVEIVSNFKTNNKLNKNDFVFPKIHSNLFPDQKTLKQINDIFEKSLSFDKLSAEQIKLVYDKFNLNAITKSSLQFFDICVSHDLNKLIIPFKSCYNKNTITGIQLIEFNNEENKLTEKLIPSDMGLSVFGLNQQLVNNCSFDELVITDSPLDAIAVTQETNIPCVSFASYGMWAQFRPEILPFFEQFKKVNICLLLLHSFKRFIA
jgi:hypothetical protein